jgi:NADH-quinone oxidoreductase subunit E
VTPEQETERETPPAEPDLAQVERLLDELQVSPRSNLIGVLQDIQERFGYLPAAALAAVSRRAKFRLSRIWGVVTFYAQFYTEPRGRHTIRCCRGTACHVKGAGRVLEAVKRELGVEEDETTPDMMFHLETVACLGTCFLAPAMMIDGQYYGMLTPQKVVSILRSFRSDTA